MGLFSWWRGGRRGGSTEQRGQPTPAAAGAAAPEAAAASGAHGAVEVRRQASDATVFEFGSAAESGAALTLAGYCPVSDELEPCRWELVPAAGEGAPQFRIDVLAASTQCFSGRLNSRFREVPSRARPTRSLSRNNVASLTDNTLSSLAATLPAPMALNNLLNLPTSKIALKPPLPPLPTRPSLSAPPRRPFARVSLARSEPPRPQRVQSSPSSEAAPSPPSSREEAVAQARSCLAAALQKPLNNSVPLKKQKRQRQARFRAEIPVVDDSPGSLARLAFDVFSAGVKRKGAPARLLLVWPSAEALAAALREHSNWGDSTAHAQLDAVAPDALGACDAAVFLAPATSQVDKVRAAAATLEPKPVVLFNPAWSFDEEEQGGDAFGGAGAKGFVASFDVVYSFTGLEVRGLLSKKTGVLLRCVDGGRFGGESWVLMVEADAPAKAGEFRVVSRLKRRPTIGEVETMLYNLMAANSPVTKSARFLREMVSNVTGRKANQ
ncbi:hypothetical protein EJB05_36235, partial [Eragrostis curvula]